MSRSRSLPAVLVALTLSTGLGLASGPSASARGDGESATASHVVPGVSLAKVRQRAKLEMHPQIAQPGKRTGKARKAQSVMTATFQPRKKGRKVVLQRKHGKKWVKVAQGKENRQGRVDFAAPYKVKGKNPVYRVLAAKKGRLGTVHSKGVKTTRIGALDFNDEFTARSLGSAWTYRNTGTYAPQSQRACSKADPQAVKVVGGTVRLSVLDDPARPTGLLDPNPKCSSPSTDGESYDWRLNGTISTEGRKSYLYGYSAARIKFQPRRGQHGSFWMQPEAPKAYEGSAGRTGAEVDIIEWFGNHQPQGGVTSFIYHYPDNGTDGVTPDKVGGFIKKPNQYGGDWAKKYHVFSVEWTPKEYVFRIDGQETFRTSKGVSGIPEYLILSQLSSDYELKYLGGEKNLPQTMSVDWVRHWAR